jgi:broad specificity phosphatase PhoE
MVKLYLVRHGESEANVNHEIMRSKPDSDIQLTGKGYYDALSAGLYLKKYMEDYSLKIDYPPLFLISPWKRAQQTYKVISSVVSGHKRDDLSLIHEHEMNLNGHSGNWKKFIEYRNSGWDTTKYYDVKFQGGETLREMRNRAKKFVNILKSGEFGMLVVAVSHGQFIKEVISVVKKIHPNSVQHPANGQVIELEIK